MAQDAGCQVRPCHVHGRILPLTSWASFVWRRLSAGGPASLKRDWSRVCHRPVASVNETVRAQPSAPQPQKVRTLCPLLLVFQGCSRGWPYRGRHSPPSLIAPLTHLGGSVSVWGTDRGPRPEPELAQTRNLGILHLLPVTVGPSCDPSAKPAGETFQLCLETYHFPLPPRPPSRGRRLRPRLGQPH